MCTRVCSRRPLCHIRRCVQVYAVLPPLHGHEAVLLGARAPLPVTPGARLGPWRVGAEQAASRPALVPGGAPCSSAVAATVPTPRRELGLPEVCFFLRMPLSSGSSGLREPSENPRSSTDPLEQLRTAPARTTLHVSTRTLKTPPTAPWPGPASLTTASKVSGVTGQAQRGDKSPRTCRAGGQL